MEIGIATFVDTDPAAGAAGARDRLRQLVEQASLAEEVGLDVVAVGEHHRPDFAVSSPAVVLAALA
ncbi:MAG: LLM class flavin-dependent oxidoreductase, partial [Pyrinomonadaceae bacterium]